MNTKTGKTLLAFKLAKKAISNGWMFIYLKDCKLTGKVLEMCKYLHRNGHGVVLFSEDIDQAMRGNRDAAMQEILNTLDGGDTKHINVISIFSTNHIELIEPTFLRGKRIGSIIQLGFIDEKMANEFIDEFIIKSSDYDFKHDPEVTLQSVCKLIAENEVAPAFMAEIIEKIKTIGIYKQDRELTTKDIKLAVESYLGQVKLAKVKDTTATPESRLFDALKSVTVTALTEAQMDTIADKVYEKIN